MKRVPLTAWEIKIREEYEEKRNLVRSEPCSCIHGDYINHTCGRCQKLERMNFILRERMKY